MDDDDCSDLFEVLAELIVYMCNPIPAIILLLLAAGTVGYLHYYAGF